MAPSLDDGESILDDLLSLVDEQTAHSIDTNLSIFVDELTDDLFSYKENKSDMRPHSCVSKPVFMAIPVVPSLPVAPATISPFESSSLSSQPFRTPSAQKYCVPTLAKTPYRRLSVGKLSNLDRQVSRHDYRRYVAIPRYLDKKKRRRWGKELMHPSRSAAAHRRNRNGGQFSVVRAARFMPVTEM